MEQVVNDALAGSALLKRIVDTGQLGVVGAYYELVSGRVMFSEMVRSESPAPGSKRH